MQNALTMINDRLAKEQKLQKHLVGAKVVAHNNTAAKASFLGAILNNGQVSSTQNKWAPRSVRNIQTEQEYQYSNRLNVGNKYGSIPPF